MRVKSSVTGDLCKHLHPQSSQPGIMYELSKIHKLMGNGFPNLRLILSAINTGTYKWTVKDSFDFVKDITQQRLPLMWIPFSQACHLMKLLVCGLTNYLNMVKQFLAITSSKFQRCFH